MGAWDMLPGYLRVPRAPQVSLQQYVAERTPAALLPDSMNYWSNTGRFMASLLKAWYGRRATGENEFGYGNLPKIAPGEDHGWVHIFDRMYAGAMEGLISFGMNPVANGPNSAKMIAALGKLKWPIVAECFETETAAFWDARQLAAKDYPAAAAPADIGTEVFLAARGLLRREGRRLRQQLALAAVEAQGARPAGPGAARPGESLTALPHRRAACSACPHPRCAVTHDP
jgi:hypothetical protein